MKTTARVLIVLVVLMAGVAAGGYLWVRGRGFSAREEPSRLEEALARRLRVLALPAGAAERRNPVPATPEVLQAGLEHFADHCAACHANDGSGDTEMGRGMYPKAPDMRLAGTQDLTDGELFYIIENGVRFTGMPGWSTGTPEGEEASWHLVHFIRRLPDLTPEELEQMRELNPRSPAEIREEIEIERFLRGDDDPPPDSPPTGHVHPEGAR